MKRKVLFVSEASFASTGFGNIYNELISRVHATGKFRVAELACNAVVNDPRDTNIKWRMYPNQVLSNDPRYAEYDQNKNNKFGLWRFDKTLLDFEPDIVVDLRDPPFFHYQGLSPLRPYFHWCICPTVDSAPQMPDWINLFASADSVLPYSDFGTETLEKAHPDINLVPKLGPGVNIETFRPEDKAEARKKLGIDPDAKVLGFVSRNQKRKLFPNLLRTLRSVLDDYEISGNPQDNVLLHLHTAYPDIDPWNLGRLLIEHRMYNHTLFTYACSKCPNVFCSKWKGPATCCPECNGVARHPSSARGVSQDVMRDIYNCYDLYTQFSNCEGLGLGALEAAACGVPLALVDYSAMESINTDLNGFRIDYRLSRDINTDAERAVPNESNAAFVFDETLFKMSKDELKEHGDKTRQLCIDRYDWDKIAAKWVDHLESVELKDMRGKWGAEKLPEFVPVIGDGPLSEVHKGLQKVGRSDLCFTYLAYELASMYRNEQLNLINGISTSQLNDFLTKKLDEYKNFTDINLGKKIMPSEDFIRYADIKEVSNLDA